MQKLIKIFHYYYFLFVFYLKLFFIKKNKLTPKSLTSLLKELTEYQKIIIVASGPSSEKLKVNKNDLYIVTNSAYKLVKDASFIYMVSDNHFVTKYLSKGLRSQGLKGVLFRFSTKEFGHYKIYQRVENYLKISKKKIFEILLSDFHSKYSDDTGFNTLESWTQSHFNIPFKQQNSGMLILLTGYFIAHSLKKDMEIYGIDAGVGGLKHFDNKGVIGDSVFKDRVKVNIKNYLDKMYAQNEIIVKNYSNFNSNT